MRSFGLLVLGLFLLLPVPMQAQRPDITALRDSLRQVRDVDQLYRLQRAQPMPGVARSAESIFRRGVVEIRIWQVTQERSDAERARETFKRGLERFPRAALLYYGHALSLAEGPEVRLPSPGGVLEPVIVGQSIAEILRRDPKSTAQRELRRALELEPGFGEAAVLLARLALLDGGRSRSRLREARAALLAAREAGARGVGGALAEIETALGDYAAASAAADAGADAGTLYAQAVALLLQDGRQGEGVRAYARALEQLDAATAERIYRDVEPIATPAETAEWQAAQLEGRRFWLERFWSRRAADAGVLEAERIAEHYQRLADARARFLRGTRAGGESVGSLLGQRPLNTGVFDDRGLVLLKHGAPLRIVRSTARGLLPNETWVYTLPDVGTQLFHFVATRGAQDYYLTSDLLQAIDPSAPLEPDQRITAVMALVEDRATFDPQYRSAATRLRSVLQRNPGIPLDHTEVRQLLEGAEAGYRRGARIALARDTHLRFYDDDIALQHDVFSFRTPEGRTELTAALAIPARDVQPLSGSSGTDYRLRVSVIVVDTLLGTVTRRDTAQTIRVGRPLAADDFLRTHVSMPVVPTDHGVYRIVLEDMTSGSGTQQRGAARIRELGGQELLISDVVIAFPDSAGDWSRGDTRLALLLPRRFGADRPFTIFYELYNLTDQQPYTTRITVESADRRGGLRGLFRRGAQPIELRFDDVARPDANGVVQQTRRVASELDPGSYRLIITIQTRDGGSARTETTFTVAG